MNDSLLSEQNLPKSLAAVTKTPKTLFDLLNKYRVIIPGIQRHYVQGDDTAKARDVRTTFIRDVFTHIKGWKPLSLDFVYGPIDTSETDAFIPIDGQQRLTTLWLLARYFSEFLNPADKRAVVGLLNRFSYEGRTHATRFCAALTAEDSSFVGTGWRPSDSIRRSTWFNPYWLKDKTVSGMLNTLDMIADTHGQDAFEDIEATTGLEYMHSRLTFELRVEAFADDIYMKMNARGLRLTQWENFKGRFSNSLQNKESRADWDRRIEALSDAYFDKTEHLPDNAFFAYCARMVAYESRNATQDIAGNLVKLAHSAGSVDWDGELVYVPYDEFDAAFKAGAVSASQVAKPFLDLLQYVTEGDEVASLPCPYWNQDRRLIQAAFKPENRNELDFSLCLYEYFKIHSSPKRKSFEVALRLMWNVLENVAPDAKDQYYKRVDAIKALIVNSGETLYHAHMHFGETAVQYLEEEVKGDVYASHPASDIELMQQVESFMHGRIRLGILDLKSDNKPDFNRKRLEILKRLFTTYLDPSERREQIVLMAVAAAPLPLEDEIALSVNPDNLRKILTNRNDKAFQKTLIDFLIKSGQDDPTTCAPEAILKSNLKSNPVQLPNDAPWWKRDFRNKTLCLADKQSAYRTRNPNFTPWGCTIRRHNTDHHYLYAGDSIPHALPINDYRLELAETSHPWPLATDNYQPSVEMNDGNTHSGKPGNKNLMVYFYPDHIEVRQWNDQEKRFDDNQTVRIPPIGQSSSPETILADLQGVLDRWAP